MDYFIVTGVVSCMGQYVHVVQICTCNFLLIEFSCCKLLMNTEQIPDHLIATIWLWSFPHSKYDLRQDLYAPPLRIHTDQLLLSFPDPDQLNLSRIRIRPILENIMLLANWKYKSYRRIFYFHWTPVAFIALMRTFCRDCSVLKNWVDG